MNKISDILEGLKLEREPLTEMANLIPKKSGISVDIWSEHRGIRRNKKDVEPRVKIGLDDTYSISVSIEEKPRILAVSSSLRKKKKGSPEWKKMQEGIDYVGRNADLFLRHYNDTDDSFDDDDLKDELRKRGEYK